MKILKSFRTKYLNGYFESGVCENDNVVEDVIYFKIKTDSMKKPKLLEMTVYEANDMIELLKTATYEYEN